MVGPVGRGKFVLLVEIVGRGESDVPMGIVSLRIFALFVVTMSTDEALLLVGIVGPDKPDGVLMTVLFPVEGGGIMEDGTGGVALSIRLSKFSGSPDKRWSTKMTEPRSRSKLTIIIRW